MCLKRYFVYANFWHEIKMEHLWLYVNRNLELKIEIVKQ